MFGASTDSCDRLLRCFWKSSETVQLVKRHTEMNPLHYGEPLYWEERYKLEAEKSMDGFTLFDWYMPFDSGGSPLIG